MTLSGAVRYDHSWSYYPEQQIGPTRFLPTPIFFPETKGVIGYNDITPRAGVAYDLFGNGKTALKGNVGKYLEAAVNGTKSLDDKAMADWLKKNRVNTIQGCRAGFGGIQLVLLLPRARD